MNQASLESSVVPVLPAAGRPMAALPPVPPFITDSSILVMMAASFSSITRFSWIEFSSTTWPLRSTILRIAVG